VLYTFDDCTLDTQRRELMHEGKVVAIEPQVFDLLHYLILTGTVSSPRVTSLHRSGAAGMFRIQHSRLESTRRDTDSGEAQQLLRTLRGKGFRLSERCSRRPPIKQAIVARFSRRQPSAHHVLPHKRWRQHRDGQPRVWRCAGQNRHLA